MSWTAHALLTAPSRLFDANIFYPEKLTLAYSEAMLVQALFAVPVIAAGGSAVLAYNVAVIAGFALTGWALGRTRGMERAAEPPQTGTATSITPSTIRTG